ncbi:MAG: EipB family protein [Pseudomonadota bacterium]
MHRLVGLLLAGAMLAPATAGAQVRPHRAEYALRLGAAANAPRIGTAVQDLTQDCDGWHIKRDIKSEIAITSSWKMSLGSRLDGRESRDGHAFRFGTVQTQNGSERSIKGKVQRDGGELRAELVQPGSPPHQFILPPPTLMPVAAIDHLISQLKAKAAAFPALMFDAEVIGDALLVEVTEQERGRLRGARPADEKMAPDGKSWPVFMSFTRGREQTQRPLFTVDARVYENGVLDRLTIDTGLVTVTADLQALEMRPAATCPRS